jgi:hypothetical protein
LKILCIIVRHLALMTTPNYGIKMIKKIISGGQTGADQAALDVAIDFNIPHGGWISKGRKTEKGRLPDRYHLKETNTIDDAQRTELNIVDSDATLLFSHGVLKGGSALTRDLAKKHNKSCLHIDLDEINEYKIVDIVRVWLRIKKVSVLNIAGPRSSEDPQIYDDVKRILNSLLHLPPQYITLNLNLPQTVQETLDRLISGMPMREKFSIANMKEENLFTLCPTLGAYIHNHFKVMSGNEPLLQSCRYALKKYEIQEMDVSLLIIKELWKRLREMHALRVVK